MMTTKPSHKLTFHDRLSRLSFHQAAKLLGVNGSKLIREGGKIDVNLDVDVHLSGDLFRVSFPHFDQGAGLNASLTLHPEARNKLHFNCEACDTPCEHVGALFSVLLENKSLLGLAAPPPERTVVPTLDEDALVKQCLRIGPSEQTPSG